MKLKDLRLLLKDLNPDCEDYEITAFDDEYHSFEPVTGIHFYNQTIQLWTDKDEE